MGNKELLITLKGGEFAISGQTMFKDTREGKMVYIRLRRKTGADGKRGIQDIPTSIPANARGKVKELKALLQSTIEEFDEKWEKELALAAGTIIDASKIALMKYLFDYNDEIHLGENGIAETTYHGYKGNIKRFGDYLESKGLKNLLLQDLRVWHIDDFINWCKAKQLTVRTIKRYLDAIRPALRKANLHELIAKNPFNLIEQKKLKRAPMEEKPSVSFTRDELNEFWNTVEKQKSPLRKIFRLTFMLGLRRSEVLGLRWSHINFSNKTILICGSVQKINGRLVLNAKKNKTIKSKATFPISQELFDLLQSIKADIQEYQGMFGGQYQHEHNDFICVDPLGVLFNPDYLSQHLITLLKKQGLNKGITFHSLRHTAGTFVYRKNNDILAAMRFLRHTDIRTTQIYLHVDEETTAVSVETMPTL
ncbi:MAG: tyrosine-type recombinase/integrase [Firmicutes bacterium]|nr:tyrosine-type recombinase/integrase [Bacillota bacterium]